MKLRKQKKQIPADFRRQMYESYKANMAFFGKPASPYKQWLKDVLTLKYQQNEKDCHYFNRTISPDSVRIKTS